MMDIPFFSRQMLIALRNRGLIDPEDIDQYLARDGYAALTKAFTRMTPEEILEQVKISGLRGRGGAGFPTGTKWEAVRAAEGEPKYLICNGMDRSILETDPHSVIEGMVIGARAMGARWGVIYIRNEYPLAVKRIHIAIDQAHERGFLGKNILDTGFDFDISVSQGAGAFICGEATAVVAVVEGKLGEPRARPPRLAEKGLWGKPTCLSNVETWANVPPIISRGGGWFAQIGTEKSKGTKIFSLVGKIKNTGQIEVPMGITLREIVHDIGGGIPEDKKFKAVQIGGPTGGLIPNELIDLPVDFESLAKIGSLIGSGSVVVMDEDTCMVDVARSCLSFAQDESCGKCTPCREGTKLMLDTLTRITEGHGTMEDLESLEAVGKIVAETSLCGLGTTAPNPVLTTLRYFRDEYVRHIEAHKCPAHACRQLNTYHIDPEICVQRGHGCGVCRRECPEKAIIGEKNQPHRIDVNLCSKCGTCLDLCHFHAVTVE
jgi:NADH:ubiquinone oxidoreductase subunit F (NADH-binding)/Pyruvate/2-oxoacid:ferredoxin oxidoreductase delta subunit